MARQLEPLQSRLLNLVQEEVPLVERPFEEIGRRLNIPEAKVVEMLRDLKSGEHRIIRQISAIFDTKALGYRSSLVAAKIEPSRIDEAAEVINAHPGVSHNYKRNHAYNLWYTVAVPPDSKLGLENTIQLLHEKSGAIQTRMMPTLKLYKIGVKLNLGGDDIAGRTEAPRFTEEDRQAAAEFKVTDEDKRMIRVLQQDLPLEERPYDKWAQQAQVSVPVLLEAARRYEQQKRMRRFSAVLHHREVGFKANGMGVWVVPAEQAESFGQTAGSYAAVSHCYLRPTYPDWPYNIFTMVHAQDTRECDKVLETISAQTGVKEYAALYSSKEYKKVRVRYFTPDVEKWEAANA
jgi:DNA-binding Lrp family transcriptional regulator